MITTYIKFSYLSWSLPNFQSTLIPVRMFFKKEMFKEKKFIEYQIALP